MPIVEAQAPVETSWVASANSHADFPLQNLPLGVFEPVPADDALAGARGGPRGGVAIGDRILDLGVALELGAFEPGLVAVAEAAAAPALNGFFELGAAARRALRTALHELLRTGSGFEATARRAAADPSSAARPLLHEAARCRMHLPARIGDYTDFFAGIHHALNVGRIYRPDAPLLPNYRYVPIGYHGRTSSIRVSGTPLRRPHGQARRADSAVPFVGPCAKLDFELEMGCWVGPGIAQGETLAAGAASAHLAGFCLLNDWSARDIQAWESQPLGPFLGKSFMTTISPWVVAPEALDPFRSAAAPRPAGVPGPLPYLDDPEDQRRGAFDLKLEARISSAAMRAQGLAPLCITRSNSRHLYWTFAQLLTHHASNGSGLRSGDLFGSGTISGEDVAGCGSLLELSLDGRRPFELPGGETRRFLEAGDEISLHARATRSGCASIGFGECRGRVLD